jgi:hypothetical protein
MKYDDAEYCFLNFETDRLPNEAGGTHTGMYLAWAASKGLLDMDFDEAVLAPLKARQVTGSQFYFQRCDGKLTDDDFNDVGNAFTASYYEKSFAADYQQVFADQMPNGAQSTDDFCSVPDTWENYDRLAPLLDQRFEQWRKERVARSAPPSAEAPAPAPGSAAAAPLALAPEPAESLEALRARAAGTRPAAPPHQAAEPPGRVGVAPVVALLIGAAGFILLLLAAMAVKGTALQAVALLLGAVSAFGAYRCSLGLEKSAGMALLLAVLAFVPVVGSFVCLALVLQILRRHGSR